MDEEYTQSDISKEVERLMDEEGFEFGEAVKEAMSKGYKNGGLMVAIQKFNQGGNVIDSRATTQDFTNALKKVSAGTTYQQQADAKRYAKDQANQMLTAAMQSGNQGNIQSILQGVGGITSIPGMQFNRSGNRITSIPATGSGRDKILNAMANQMLSTTSYGGGSSAPPQKSPLQLKIEENKKIYDEYVKNNSPLTGIITGPQGGAPTPPKPEYEDQALLSKLTMLTPEEAFGGETFDTLSDLDQYNFAQAFTQFQPQLRDPSYVSPYGAPDGRQIFSRRYGIKDGGQVGMAGGKTYHQYHDQYVPRDEESMGYANGGGIGSMMIPKRGLVNEPGGYSGRTLGDIFEHGYFMQGPTDEEDLEYYKDLAERRKRAEEEFVEDDVFSIEDIFERDTPLTEGIFGLSEGFTLSPLTILRRYLANKELENKVDYADGGRVGLFMGGSPLTGEALNIYTSMNSYGYTDQEIADRLSGLGLYTPDSGTTTPSPNTTPPGGGGGGGGGGGAGTTTTTTKTRDKKIDQGIAAAEADKGSLTLEEIKAMNDLSGQESMRGQPTTTTSVLEELISAPPKKPPQSMLASEILEAQKANQSKGLSARGKINRAPASQALDDEYYDKEIIGITDRNRGQIPTETTSVLEEIVSNTTPGLKITDRNRGMEDNENFIDRGNPTNDLRVADLLEQRDSAGGIFDRDRGQITPNPTGGITTIDRPNMKDIAGSSIKNQPIEVGIPDESGFVDYLGTTKAAPDMFSGYAKDPDVEDPYGGKYTPSFEEKKAAEGILAGLLDKAADFNLSDINTLGQNLSINKALKTLGFADIPSFLGTKAISSGIDYFKNKKVQKEIKKQAASAKTRRETREIQNRTDRQENNINRNASKNDSKSGSSIVNPNSSYGKKQGYTGGNPNPHTSTGWSGSTKSGGGGNKGSGGGKKSGGSKSSGKNSSQQGGGFNQHGFSDIRLKDNIELVGKSKSDINIYNFTYLNDPTVYQGVMAHEVPWASVKHDSGYLMVDYNKIDVDFKSIR